MTNTTKCAFQIKPGEQVPHPLIDGRWATVASVTYSGSKVMGTDELIVRLNFSDGGVAKAVEIPVSRKMDTRPAEESA